MNLPASLFSCRLGIHFPPRKASSGLEIITSDMMASMQELPLLAVAALAVCGLVLWLGGWWSHRFWAALGCTLAAGVYGLQRGEEFGVPPAVSGILLAVSGGVLALSLMRVAVFAASGLACWWLVQAFFPHWTVPVVCLVAGGLAGLLFYRFWVTLITSAVGAVVLGHCGLVLAAVVAPTFDAPAWCAARCTLLNAILGGGTLGGVAGQYLFAALAEKISGWRKSLSEAKPAKDRKSGGGFFSLRKAG